MRRTTVITDLIHNAVDFALRGSNVRGDIILPAQLWTVEVDPSQIRQVIHNVILNAQQAMPQGGIVEVRADNLPSDAALPPLIPPGRWLKITIRDQGCGIPADPLMAHYRAYGFRGVLSKPYTVEGLEEVLQQVLQDRRN